MALKKMRNISTSKTNKTAFVNFILVLLRSISFIGLSLKSSETSGHRYTSILHTTGQAGTEAGTLDKEEPKFLPALFDQPKYISFY